MSTSHPAQANLIPSDTFTAAGGDPSGVGPAWYPDIQPFNISQAIKLTPGYGEPNATCGDVRYFETCPDHPEHHAVPRFYRCHRPACPECWPSWAGRQTKSAAEALEGYQSLTRTRYKPRHIDISPAPADIPTFADPHAALTWLYDQAREKSRILGVTAAITFPHPYRIRPEKKEEVEAAATAAGQKRYEWALAQPNWTDFVYFSPHMHLLAFGHFLTPEAFQAKTGWQYHNHDDRTKGRDGDALRKTIFYLLTHTWVNGNHKIVRYLYGMSTHNMKRVDEGYEKIKAACPVCAAALVANPPDIIRADGTTMPVYQNLHNAPPAMRKILFHHYEFREKKRQRNHASAVITS